MDYQFNILLQNRKMLYAILRKTPRESLFEIPGGFRNHVFWNIAHVVVTQQLITYGLSNLPMHISAEWIAKYRKGTMPGAEQASDEEITEMQDLLFCDQ